MKKSSLTLAAAVLGLSLCSTNADAQGWRGWFSWGNQNISSGGCSHTQRNTLRQDVYSIDRTANQMAFQFSREMHCGCPASVALLNHLKKNASLTRNLVTASNGTCKCAFKKAACAVNENMACVAKRARKVSSLSCMLRSSIAESVQLAKRIHRNADRFVPRNNNSYTNNRRPRPSFQPPVYTRPPVSGNHGHDHGHGHDDHGHDAHGHDDHGHDAHGHDDHDGHNHGTSIFSGFFRR